MKNPLLGALLATFFGPLGMIYYSWRKALLFLFALFIIILIYMAMVPEASIPSWVKFVVLPTLGVYVFFDIKKHKV